MDRKCLPSYTPLLQVGCDARCCFMHYDAKDILRTINELVMPEFVNLGSHSSTSHTTAYILTECTFGHTHSLNSTRLESCLTLLHARFLIASRMRQALAIDERLSKNSRRTVGGSVWLTFLNHMVFRRQSPMTTSLLKINAFFCKRVL